MSVNSFTGLGLDSQSRAHALIVDLWRCSVSGTSSLKRNEMKLLVLSVVCLGLGFWLQREQRLETGDLELRATLAWNAGNLDVAEHEARRAYARDPDSVRAREVLIKFSRALQRPEIQLAVLLQDYQTSEYPGRSLVELGRAALSWNLFRLADNYFAEGVTRFPENEMLQRQSVALSGLRLDAEKMQARLTNWARHGTPTPDLVMMSLGLSSIDSRGATPPETWLKAALEADSTDIDSRLGLARCLLAMGRYRESIGLLKEHQQHPQAGLLLALAYATVKDLPAAAQVLPSTEPAESRADYWFANGLVALERKDLPAAEAAFRNAVRYQPLNQTYRSRFCEVLRRLDHAEQHRQQVQELDVVVRIIHRSKQSERTVPPALLNELAEMCRSVGAHEAAELLSKSVGE